MRYLTVSLMMPDAVELSVCIGVGCWGCSNYSNVFFITSPFSELMNRPPNSDASVDAVIFYRIAVTTYTAPLYLVGELGSKWSLRKKCPPTLLLALDTDKYEASLWMCNCIGLEKY